MNTITENPQTTALCEKLQRVAGLFEKDIDAMSDSDLAATHGGKSRCGYDLVYEITGMLKAFTAQLRGVEPTDTYATGWPCAPAELKTKEQAAKAFNEALDEFVATLKSYPGDVEEERFKGPAGSMSAVGLAELARGHTLYHSGQLNYIQTINGDAEFHWF